MATGPEVFEPSGNGMGDCSFLRDRVRGNRP